MNQNGIPYELRVLNQWVGVKVTWNEQKQKYDKIPISAAGDRPGSVSDPKTWGTFDQVLSTGFLPGFVLTKNDPYTIIDLDSKTPDLVKLHAEIIAGADSYTETSYSGHGSHIVVKGTLDAGLRDDLAGIEVYPHDRFILMTGDCYTTHHVNDGQELIDYLAHQINSKRVAKVESLTSEVSGLSDEDVYNRASGADNGHKFLALFSGQWRDFPEYQNDHSRADLGLLTFLDFYTKDVDQVIRLFKYSKLYRPEKGRRGGDGTDYIIRTLKAARARNEADQPPPVDLGNIMQAAQQVVATMSEHSSIEPEQFTTENSLPPPPGLIGEIATYVYTAATRPVPEVAIAAALTLIAGLVGRHYNISGTGLNLYMILLAPTGSGKEGASSGINSLIHSIRQIVPCIDQFVGPGDFASGQGLIKTLADRPSIYSLVGEFGIRMQQLASPRASSAEKMLQRALLNLFSKSGWHQSESGLAYSDRDKNTPTLFAPALSILGDSTPETYFAALDENLVMSGLLPRFCHIEYRGIRPPRNKVTAFVAPNTGLVNRLADLASTVVQMQANSACQDVGIDDAALGLLDNFDAYADEQINAHGEVYKQLWNRAHLKALRLSALLAVGCNHITPVVTAELAQWAIAFVKQDVECIATRFKNEEVGEGEHRYEGIIRKLVEEYFQTPIDVRRSTFKVPQVIIDQPIIPYTYFRRRMKRMAMFEKDRRGLTRAIKESLQDAVDADILKLIPMTQRQQQFNLSGDLYVVGDSW